MWPGAGVVPLIPVHFEGITIRELNGYLAFLLILSITVICSSLGGILYGCRMFSLQRHEFGLRTDMLKKLVAFIGSEAEKKP